MNQRGERERETEQEPSEQFVAILGSQNKLLRIYLR